MEPSPLHYPAHVFLYEDFRCPPPLPAEKEEEEIGGEDPSSHALEDLMDLEALHDDDEEEEEDDDEEEEAEAAAQEAEAEEEGLVRGGLAAWPPSGMETPAGSFSSMAMAAAFASYHSPPFFFGGSGSPFRLDSPLAMENPGLGLSFDGNHSYGEFGDGRRWNGGVAGGIPADFGGQCSTPEPSPNRYLQQELFKGGSSGFESGEGGGFELEEGRGFEPGLGEEKGFELSESASSLTERMYFALGFYIGHGQGDVLAQVWVPKRVRNKLFLTTEGQPFVLRHAVEGLSRYRRVSAKYTFSADEEDPEALPGFPGRIFLNKKPEWTPDVQYYSKYEYLRLQEATMCNVHGSIGVPVIEQSSKSCIAVLELVMSSESVEYGPEIQNICRALQAVDLCSSDESNCLPKQMQLNFRESVMAEISQVLTVVSKKHKLPLAQTWLPFSYSSNSCHAQMGAESGLDKVGARVCLFTGDAPFFVGDAGGAGVGVFRQACAEHFLEKEQGVPGKAFVSNQPFFSRDVRTYSKAEYPLVHYALKFSMVAAVAIRLRSINSGSNDYILEFFLPPECLAFDDQQSMLNEISSTMQRICKTLRTLTPKELLESISPSHSPLVEPDSQLNKDTTNPHANQSPSVAEKTTQGYREEEEEEPEEEEEEQISCQQQEVAPLKRRPKQMMSSERVMNVDRADNDLGGRKKRQDKKKGTMEKTVSLNVLQRYFAGSLKDAAKA